MRVVATLAVFGVVAPLAPAQLTVTREAAGQKTTSQTGTLSTNTFNTSILSSNNVGSYTTYGTSDPGVATGTYTATGNGFGIFNDQFGGDTTLVTRDNYFSTGGRTAPGSTTTFLDPSATLTLSSTAYYLGINWMAVDSGNSLSFYKGNTLVQTLTAAEITADAGISAGTTYNGTDGNNTGKNVAEKYVFLNIYAKTASDGFDKVVFSNTGGSGFESDNHTISFALIAAQDQVGTLVPVPEPAGLLAAAGGLLLAARRLRRG